MLRIALRWARLILEQANPDGLDGVLLQQRMVASVNLSKP